MASKTALRGVLLGVIGLATPAGAGPVNGNWIANGSFETSTTTQSTKMTNSNVSGWATTSGYTFLVYPGKATVNLDPALNDSTLYLYGGGAFPSTSPDGGNFLVSDGGYLTGYESQTLTGLTIGTRYEATFWQAAGQQFSFSGTTTEQWRVGFGTSYASSSFQTTTLMSTPSQSFIGWNKQTLSFIATATTEFLSFEALGTPSGQPPFVLLDGVTFTVPEPGSIALFGGCLLVLLGTRARARYALTALVSLEAVTQKHR